MKIDCQLLILQEHAYFHPWLGIHHARPEMNAYPKMPAATKAVISQIATENAQNRMNGPIECSRGHSQDFPF
jgi:hypothetical protein